MTAAVAENVQAPLPEYSAGLFVPHRWKVLYGGRGGARSWTVARALLIKTAAQPLRILCTRELQTSIRDSVHQLLRDQIELLGLRGFTVVHNEIRHDNGSVFLFEGLRYNARQVKSLEGVDICWVEEAERISKESWDILIPTIRKAGSEIWVTFNPDQEEDATYQMLIVNPPKDAYIRKVSWQDNPWFHETALVAEKDRAFAIDPDSANHVWGGDLRLVTDAQILKGKWVIEEFEPFLGHTSPDECEDLQEKRDCTHGWGGPYQGLDFGFAQDPAAATRSWVDGRRLYVEYDWYKLSMDIDFLAASVRLAIPGFEHYVTRADSARPDSISFLRRHGLPRIVGAKKGPGSVEDGVAHLRSYDKIIVHPRCKHFADECKRYSYKVDERSGDVLPIILDKHNHCMDAERYSLEPLIKPQRKVGVIFVGSPTKGAGKNSNGNGHPHNALVGINRR